MFYFTFLLWILFGFLSFGILGIDYFWARRVAKKEWDIEKDVNYLPRVSIIVPTYNENEVIDYKLENLSKLEYPADLLQIVFIDSQSTDGTPDRIRNFAQRNLKSDVKIVSEEQRKGKSYALNRALKDCVGEVIVISDADCFWPPRILNESLCYFATPSVGAVSGPKQLLNKEDSWITRNESSYLESMNRVKLGESKTGSTILFEGGFAAFEKSAFDIFDPYKTGSDDCGTVIRVLENNKRAIMVPEAAFFTFFPKTWKGRTSVKTRRAMQLVRVLKNYMTLLFRGKLKLARRTVVRNAFLYFFAPIMFLGFLISTVFLFVAFPPSVLLLLLFVIPKVSFYFIDTVQSFLTMFVALIMVLSKRNSLIWSKPEDRNLVTKQQLVDQGLI